jgi:hypothetical protein
MSPFYLLAVFQARTPHKPPASGTHSSCFRYCLERSLTIKMKSDDMEMLSAEAKRRGFTDLAPFARELILSNMSLPTPTTLILEVLLQFQYAMYELAERSAAGQPLPQAKIQSLRAKLETVGESLVASYVNRRRQRPLE